MMQRKARSESLSEATELDFRINSAMKKSELNVRVIKAENYFNTRRNDYSPAKNLILALTIKYAKDSLVAIFAKDDSRYVIYSNIVNMADHFADDIHFLAYVVRQLKQINRHDNSSFRATVLPNAEAKLKSLLAHEFLKQRRACIGLAMGGLGLLYVDPRVAVPMIVMGLTTAYFCEDIVYARLSTSLDLKLHRLDVGNHQQVGMIADGMEDIYGRITDTTAGMLNSGLHLFSLAGNRMQRLAMLGQAPANQQSRVEVLDDQSAAANLRPAASAPPLHEVDDVDVSQKPGQRLAYH
jgi:hypothetical protein